MTERPADWSDRSYYLPMRDGVRLAFSLYFPGRTPPATPRPVLLIQTRYGRAGVKRSGDPRSIDHWLEAGYVVAAVDVRGSTSSFGARDSEVGPDEQRDMDEIIAHVAGQSWSNGQVIASGVSYTANTADMATTRPAPALLAAIPRQTDFDFWELFWPGGIPNRTMFFDWSWGIYEIDFGRPRTRLGGLATSAHAGLDGRQRREDCRALFPVLQPVDEDPDCTLLQEALRTREELGPHWSPDDYADRPFRDDAGLNGHPFFEGCTGSHMAAVRRERKPVQYWGSWIDCNTAEAALSRFRSAPEVPAVVVITANTHGGDVGADPFFPEREAPLPSVADQHRLHLAFAEQIRAGRPLARLIRYYVLGAGIMRETPVWPPEGTASTRFALDEGGRLTRDAPAPGVDLHDIDFTASSGTQNRWCWITRPAYADRREDDRKLLTYDSGPMEQDMELAGWPVLTLRLATRTSDPAIFAYVEDVAPDGRVTYITEGQLRAINRRPADPATLPYDPGPAPHSFRRADAIPVIPGEPFTLRLKLFSTAALIKKGHRLRLAIAGCDKDSFAPMSNGESECFDIHRGGAEASAIEIPLRPWR